MKDGIRDKEHFEKQIFLVLDFDENPNYKKIKKRLKNMVFHLHLHTNL